MAPGHAPRRFVPLTRHGAATRAPELFCNFRTITKHAEKSTEAFGAELDSLLRHHDKVRQVHFCDDNITGSRGAIDRAADVLIDRQAPLQWSSFVSPQFLDQPLADKLRQSGCSLIKIGMESCADPVLRAMNKPVARGTTPRPCRRR